MKALVAQMQAPPTLDLDDPALPPYRIEELLRVTGEVGADKLAAMSLEALLEPFDDVMALWVWRWLGAGRGRAQHLRDRRFPVWIAREDSYSHLDRSLLQQRARQWIMIRHEKCC